MDVLEIVLKIVQKLIEKLTQGPLGFYGMEDVEVDPNTNPEEEEDQKMTPEEEEEYEAYQGFFAAAISVTYVIFIFVLQPWTDAESVQRKREKDENGNYKEKPPEPPDPFSWDSMSGSHGLFQRPERVKRREYVDKRPWFSEPPTSAPKDKPTSAPKDKPTSAPKDKIIATVVAGVLEFVLCVGVCLVMLLATPCILFLFN